MRAAVNWVPVFILLLLASPAGADGPLIGKVTGEISAAQRTFRVALVENHFLQVGDEVAIYQAPGTVRGVVTIVRGREGVVRLHEGRARAGESVAFSRRLGQSAARTSGVVMEILNGPMVRLRVRVPNSWTMQLPSPSVMTLPSPEGSMLSVTLPLRAPSSEAAVGAIRNTLAETARQEPGVRSVTERATQLTGIRGWRLDFRGGRRGPDYSGFFIDARGPDIVVLVAGEAPSPAALKEVDALLPTLRLLR